jgi:ERCC4-related helicase
VIILSEKSDFLAHPLLKENKVIRRAYQENIFINCLNKNCMVVIPTGLGKTILALMLSVYRLSEYENSKVIFLAPTKPLVDQHHESFLELTKIPKEEMCAITGAISPEDRTKIWDDLRIAFMTPQVLQNDLITQRYSISDVCLLIFDECHRATGDYAYCFLAQRYIALSKYPQILALTASPGSTEEKINEIKQNLYINHTEVRTDSDRDVKPYIQDVETTWIKIKLPKEFLEIKKILIKKFKLALQFLKQVGLLNSSDVNKVSRKDLIKLNKVINRNINDTIDEGKVSQLFIAKKYHANAIRLSHMDELIETQGIHALKDYIEKNKLKIKKNTANKSLKELFSDFEFKKLMRLVDEIYSTGLVHPKLERLKEIIHKQMKENPESRILVFCHYRDSVNNIVRFLKADSLIKVHKFVGQQTKSSDKGLTQKQQIQLLKDFKEGTYNTLIGTSVAEEGLDIAECDMVIFYDVVPSAIRSIQRRGRTGRKREGKVIILIAEGTRDESYYWAEKRKEQNMKKSLNNLKNTDSKEQSSLLQYLGNSKKKAKENEKCRDTSELTILCDNRETASPVVRILSSLGINIVLKQLPVADYVISKYIGIERKSAQDFTDSIKDGRIFNELINLKENFENAILILEGDPFLNSSLSENSLYGTISSVIVKFGIMIYQTKDSKETATFLYHLTKKAQTESSSQIRLRFDKKPQDIKDLLEYVIAGLPGINSQRAKNLLERFKTLQEIFNATKEDLMSVDNIGEKIAHDIYKWSRSQYKEDF